MSRSSSKDAHGDRRSQGQVGTEVDGAVLTVTIDRPQARNAVDPETAHALEEAFQRFGADEGLAVAVLTGAGGIFCAGFDLKALAAGANYGLREDGRGPMGPTRLTLSKPVIAAIEGYAVAGSSLARGWRRRNSWHASSRPFLKARCAPIGRARSTSGRSVLRTRCAPSSEAERRW